MLTDSEMVMESFVTENAATCVLAPMSPRVMVSVRGDVHPLTDCVTPSNAYAIVPSHVMTSE